MPDGTPRMEVPKEVLDSIRKNGVCLKGTLFTPLSHKNTSTQSLNVQVGAALCLTSAPGRACEGFNGSVRALAASCARGRASLQRCSCGAGPHAHALRPPAPHLSRAPV